MKIVTGFKRFKNYLKHGGECFITINQNHKDEVLENKTILITGGTSGIGYSIAKICSEYGANIIITGRNEEKLKKISEEIRCKYMVWDISDVNKLDSKVSELKTIIGEKLDCFVNCAGIYKDLRYYQTSEQDWDDIINTDLKGPYFAISRIATEIFEKQNDGNIVIIASNRGIFGDDGPYGIAKAGLINYGKGLANKLLNKNIRVNIVNPGMTASNINKIQDNDNLYQDCLKGKRVITSNEIANIVLFLMSDSSKCMTGQVINCDNGESNL